MSKPLTKGGETLNLKEKRESLNLTQQDIAEKLNISRTTVSMWETGDSNPRTDKLPQLAELLGCSIDDLFRGKSD